MRIVLSIVVFLFSLFVRQTAWAEELIQVEAPWARATVATQRATGVFMRLTGKEALTLVAVRSPLAGEAEIHESRVEDGVMKMRAVAALSLPAGKTVSLQPGGLHIMLLHLRAPVAAGDKVPLTLVLEDARQRRHEQSLEAEARAINAPNPGH
jgi:copper(I)-binding protein